MRRARPNIGSASREFRIPVLAVSDAVPPIASLKCPALFQGMLERKRGAPLVNAIRRVS